MSDNGKLTDCTGALLKPGQEVVIADGRYECCDADHDRTGVVVTVDDKNGSDHNGFVRVKFHGTRRTCWVPDSALQITSARPLPVDHRELMAFALYLRAEWGVTVDDHSVARVTAEYSVARQAVES